MPPIPTTRSRSCTTRVLPCSALGPDCRTSVLQAGFSCPPNPTALLDDWQAPRTRTHARANSGIIADFRSGTSTEQPPAHFCARQRESEQREDAPCRRQSGGSSPAARAPSSRARAPGLRRSARSKSRAAALFFGTFEASGSMACERPLSSCAPVSWMLLGSVRSTLRGQRRRRSTAHSIGAFFWTPDGTLLSPTACERSCPPDMVRAEVIDGRRQRWVERRCAARGLSMRGEKSE